MSNNETALYMEAVGAGPDLVLLHGWGMHSDVWAGVLPALAQRHRVTCIDLPGHGRSALEGDRFTLDSVGAILAEVAPERAIWVGWSLGGMLALHFAACYPQRVARLIAVASNPRFAQGPDWPCAMAPAVLEQFAQSLAQDYRATLLRFLALQTRGAEAERATLRSLRDGLFAYGAPAPAALRGGLNILRDADLRPLLHALDCPLHWVLGTRDALVPRTLAEHVPGIGVTCIDGAGHAPFLSHPQAFVTAVRTFLNE